MGGAALGGAGCLHVKFVVREMFISLPKEKFVTCLLRESILLSEKNVLALKESF